MPSLRNLNIQATLVTDSALRQHLVEMPQLLGLSLAYLDISDEGLSALKSIQWLERINLKHTAISKEAIVELVNEKAHSLRRLDLSNTVLDDAALAEYSDQSQLQDLRYSDTGITDAGCEHIARCEWLRSLRLDLTNITDEGMRALANCEHLRRLELFRTKVTDMSLVWLCDSKVDQLGMGFTNLTDAGMPTLTDFSHLQSLDLQGTKITDRGLRFLSEAPPVESTSSGIHQNLERWLEVPFESPLGITVAQSGHKRPGFENAVAPREIAATGNMGC